MDKLCIKSFVGFFGVAISFIIGLGLVLLLGFVFSLKTKGILRILINSVAGLLILLAFVLFRLLYIPLNPLNALLVGFFGVPGLILIVVIVLFL
ncbi:MAG: pro-sigmaK processing inhibitor BofA family protein [Firmicutes bacterium]|nr:pro-sigmaK processing inhibitor BofA family protein [Bacillota bacterium]